MSIMTNITGKKTMLLQLLNRRPWLLRGVNVFALSLFVFSMNGCAYLQSLENPEENKNEPENKFDFIERNKAQHYVAPDAGAPDEIGIGKSADNEKVEQQTKDFNRPTPKERDDKVKNRDLAPRFYEDFIVLDGDQELDVALTFNSTPLVDTLPAFADILGFNFTADSEIRSSVTINLNSRMTRRELWETFDSMLKVAGVSAIKNGQLLNIMPITKIPAQAALRVGNRYDGGSEVITRTMENVASREAVIQLRPFLTKSGAAIDVTRTNTILVSDDATNIPKLKEILDLIDQAGRQNWPRTIIYCNNVKPSKMAQELTEILPVLGFPITLSTDRTETPGSIRLTSVDRLQILVATAANEEAIKEVTDWAALLDSADASDQERLYIYKVAHGKARQLAQALTVIFATQGTAMTVDSGTGNQRNEALNAQATRQVNQTITAQNRYSTNNMPITQVDKASSVFDTPLRLFADGVQNRLVIRTTPRTYAMVKAMLDRLDVVPAQVLLQILVVEITLNDSNEFGINFNAVGGNNGTGVSTGGDFTGTPATTTDPNGFTFSVFNEKNPDEKFATLHALAGRENIKVISTPQLVVTSNTEATIQVGQRVPLLTADYTNVDSQQGAISRSYDYEDTGIILEIVPQVTSRDLIALEIKQTVSEAVKNTITSAADTPVINQRMLETTMTITNGRTMVIGGMIQEKNTDTLASVPIVSGIPFLRRVFGNTSQSVNRTELLVLITGYIIDEKSPVEDMLKRYNNSVKALSVFENELEEQHKMDLAQARRAQAERAKKEAEAAKIKAENEAMEKAANAQAAAKEMVEKEVAAREAATTTVDQKQQVPAETKAEAEAAAIAKAQEAAAKEAEAKAAAEAAAQEAAAREAAAKKEAEVKEMVAKEVAAREAAVQKAAPEAPVKEKVPATPQQTPETTNPAAVVPATQPLPKAEAPQEPAKENPPASPQQTPEMTNPAAAVPATQPESRTEAKQ